MPKNFAKLLHSLSLCPRPQGQLATVTDAPLHRQLWRVDRICLWIDHKRFRFQGIKFEGSEECRPCYWMDEAMAPGAEEFLKTRFRGGLRARMLTDRVLEVP